MDYLRAITLLLQAQRLLHITVRTTLLTLIALRLATLWRQTQAVMLRL